MTVRSLIGGDLVVAFSYVVTGELIDKHELVEVYFQPLDEHLEPYLTPFTVKMKPEKEIKRSSTFQNVGVPFLNYRESGTEKLHSKNLFNIWFEGLPLGVNNYGKPNRIILLTNRFADVKPFLYDWLGEISFYKYFRAYHRDIETIFGFYHDVVAYDRVRPQNLQMSLENYCASENINFPRHQRVLSLVADLYRRIYQNLVRRE